jgi:hypothetical protein
MLVYLCIHSIVLKTFEEQNIKETPLPFYKMTYTGGCDIYLYTQMQQAFKELHVIQANTDAAFKVNREVSGVLGYSVVIWTEPAAPKSRHFLPATSFCLQPPLPCGSLCTIKSDERTPLEALWLSYLYMICWFVMFVPLIYFDSVYESLHYIFKNFVRWLLNTAI